MHEESAALGKRLASIIGLETCPVGVYLLAPGDNRLNRAEFAPLERHRYCQAVMRARHGQRVRLTGEECACPAARSAFGFRDLPEGLASGKGLVGFGIVQEAATGRTMFEHMPRLAPGQVGEIALAPLDEAPAPPDVVVLEGPPEHLMWILLADLNRAGGERRHTNTAVLQAVCVDSTVVPHTEQRVSFTLGCYGCREATDIGKDEASLGFPGPLLAPLVHHLEALADKAIPRSRAKGALQSLLGRAEERGDGVGEGARAGDGGEAAGVGEAGESAGAGAGAAAPVPEAWTEASADRAEAQRRAAEQARRECLAALSERARAAGREFGAGDAAAATDPGEGADKPKGWRADLGALPQLERDLVLRLTPDEVIQVFQATLDQDPHLALKLVGEVLHRKIRKVLERPHCSPAFEFYRQRD